MLLTLLEQHKRKRGGEAEDLTRLSRLNCRAGSEEKNNIAAAKQIWSGITEELPGANPAFSVLLLGKGLHVRRSFTNWASSPASLAVTEILPHFFSFILLFIFLVLFLVWICGHPQSILCSPLGFVGLFLAEKNIRVQILVRALFSL